MCLRRFTGLPEQMTGDMTTVIAFRAAHIRQHAVGVRAFQRRERRIGRHLVGERGCADAPAQGTEHDGDQQKRDESVAAPEHKDKFIANA